MNPKLLVPLCAATALLVACGRTDSQATRDEVSSGIEMVEPDPVPSMDDTDTVPGTTTTPATPEYPAESPSSEMPSSDMPRSEMPSSDMSSPDMPSRDSPGDATPQAPPPG